LRKFHEFYRRYIPLVGYQIQGKEGDYANIQQLAGPAVIDPRKEYFEPLFAATCSCGIYFKPAVNLSQKGKETCKY
jgi:hypothetical protein